MKPQVKFYFFSYIILQAVLLLLLPLGLLSILLMMFMITMILMTMIMRSIFVDVINPPHQTHHFAGSDNTQALTKQTGIGRRQLGDIK